MSPQGLESVTLALDAIYQERPSNLAGRLSPILREVAGMRDELRRQQRQDDLPEADREDLTRMNQVLSLLHAAAYPVGSLDWQNLQRARALLERANEP
jgi:hypothetical protein